ncbi:GerAB/ArcD/ProY family transporter [Pullulanibacillus sp. KACC 23026]|uniref:GerAB/ArcD/ProY family transporter n=1 Tax=Pullulanibacillus sp. KACC 23026 TaxID=3028315 RepID=UPI0023B04139|nr:GerAB/ArcD/ProY family transporter [Pullulanibacillus sp. KACC 23026]WEG13481.1 GerAB/ArcD/ProY family transporter [Pullulanibacillus sp. KACC 23026]
MSRKWQIGFVFIIMYLSLNHLMYPKLIYGLTEAGHWEVVVCQGLLQITLIGIYIKGLSYFPQQDVIDIYSKMGKLVAFILLIPFALSLTALIGLDIRIHTEAINLFFLKRTPYWSVLVLLFFITTYTAMNGLSTILRSSTFIFFMILPLLLFIICSSFMNFDWHNVRPLWHPSLDFLLNKNFFHLMGYSAFLPLGFMTYKTKLTFGFIFLEWVFVMIIFLSFTYIPLLIFGEESVVTLSFPMMEAMNSVDIKWVMFNQQTIFLGLSLIGFTIIKNSVLLWIIGRIMQKVLKWKRAKASYWITASSVIAFILALIVPSRSWTETFFLWCSGVLVYFMMIIPISILIYGYVLNRGRVHYEES